MGPEFCTSYASLVCNQRPYTATARWHIRTGLWRFVDMLYVRPTTRRCRSSWRQLEKEKSRVSVVAVLCNLCVKRGCGRGVFEDPGMRTENGLEIHTVDVLVVNRKWLFFNLSPTKNMFGQCNATCLGCNAQGNEVLSKQMHFIIVGSPMLHVWCCIPCVFQCAAGYVGSPTALLVYAGEEERTVKRKGRARKKAICVCVYACVCALLYLSSRLWSLVTPCSFAKPTVWDAGIDRANRSRALKMEWKGERRKGWDTCSIHFLCTFNMTSFFSVFVSFILKGLTVDTVPI